MKFIVKYILMYVSFNIYHQYLTTLIQIDRSLTFYFLFYQNLTNSPRRTWFVFKSRTYPGHFTNQRYPGHQINIQDISRTSSGRWTPCLTQISLASPPPLKVVHERTSTGEGWTKKIFKNQTCWNWGDETVPLSWSAGGIVWPVWGRKGASFSTKAPSERIGCRASAVMPRDKSTSSGGTNQRTKSRIPKTKPRWHTHSERSRWASSATHILGQWHSKVGWPVPF